MKAVITDKGDCITIEIWHDKERIDIIPINELWLESKFFKSYLGHLQTDKSNMHVFTLDKH
jgi:hypothetical protein